VNWFFKEENNEFEKRKKNKTYDEHFLWTFSLLKNHSEFQ